MKHVLTQKGGLSVHALHVFILYSLSISLTLLLSTPQAPRSKSQRGKVSPKTSRVSRSPTTARFSNRDHVGLIPRMTSPDNQVFCIVQTLPELLIQQSSSFNNASFSIAYNNIAQSAQLTTVFDQYRIDEVQLIFRPMFLAVNMSGSTTFYVPQLYVVVDYDDANTSGYTAATYQAYSNCNVSMYETVSVDFVPHIAVSAYSGSSFNQYQNLTPKWIDTSSPNVQHYGVKAGIDAGGSGQAQFQSWSITTRVRLSLKNVR